MINVQMGLFVWHILIKSTSEFSTACPGLFDTNHERNSLTHVLL
jgi:hypothetical protein